LLSQLQLTENSTPEEEQLREIYNIPEHWQFRRFLFMPTKVHDALLDIIGEENYKFISEATRYTGRLALSSEPKTTSTLFISPLGLGRLRRYYEENKSGETRRTAWR
jgi:hypothetical protein